MLHSEIKNLVVMGASAGGIDALSRVLAGLPAALPAPVVIVQHLSMSRNTTRLPEVLQRHTQLPVCLAQDKMPLTAGAVFVAEPGKHIKIENNSLVFDYGRPVCNVQPSIDVLFFSAASTFSDKVIGVVLSGNNRDGADGCRRMKACGGVIIAQDAKSAAFAAMPRAAAATNSVDYVLALDKIAPKIMALLRNDFKSSHKR